MLSIGKLSHLAQLHENVSSVDQSALDEFHDGLDLVSVHEALIDDLRSALASVRMKQSIEMQVDTIVRAKASKLSEYRALQNVSLTQHESADEHMLILDKDIQAICTAATTGSSLTLRGHSRCLESQG